MDVSFLYWFGIGKGCKAGFHFTTRYERTR